MKTINFLKNLTILCAVLFFFSCKDEEAKIINTLEGTWELSSGTDGFTGRTTNYPSGNRTYYVFSGNKYQYFTQNNLTKSGTFNITQEVTITTKEKGNRIIFDNDPNQIRSFVNVKDDSLAFFIDAFDGSGAVYVKK